MNELHFPWLEFAVGLPLVGALWVRRVSQPEEARARSVIVVGLTFLMTVGGWIDFTVQHIPAAQDSWSRTLGPEILAIDELNAPLLPLTALLFLLTAVATLRTKVRRFSFVWALLTESLLLATYSCREPWAVIALLALGTIPPWLELRARNQPTRMYALYMSIFVGTMLVGEALLSTHAVGPGMELLGMALLSIAVLVRSGVVPFHSWMPDLFQRATFGTALLFVAPMPGVYAAMRLLLPIAPDWALRSVALLSLVTSLYAAGMTLVQKDARRFYAFLFLSHSALVLIGLELVTPIALTAALTLWLSVGIALGGFGLTLRGIEARIGRIRLDEYHGLYEHTPTLAGFFLLTGLASVGFPGTFGFVGTELLIEGVVEIYPAVGMALVLAAALNGIAVVMAYLRIFTGTHHRTSIRLRIQLPERISVMVLTLLILVGGLWPQPGITSRHHAAVMVVQSRAAINTSMTRAAQDLSPQLPPLPSPREPASLSSIERLPIQE